MYTFHKMGCTTDLLKKIKNIFYTIFFNYYIMIAIILAAWEWSRLKPLSNTIPKPMIKIFGKPILEHNLEHIYSKVDEIIIVTK